MLTRYEPDNDLKDFENVPLGATPNGCDCNLSGNRAIPS